MFHALIQAATQARFDLGRRTTLAASATPCLGWAGTPKAWRYDGEAYKPIWTSQTRQQSVKSRP